MVAVAAMGMAFTVIRSLLPDPPLVVAHRQMAKDHKNKARMWGRYAKLSKEGVTSLGPGSLNGGLEGEWMGFNHFQPRPRPEGEAEALAFDLECARTEAKCLALQAYHEGLARKWEDAAKYRQENVPPDPPPPLNIDPSGNQDIAY